jgi:protein SCO1/2
MLAEMNRRVLLSLSFAVLALAAGCAPHAPVDSAPGTATLERKPAPPLALTDTSGKPFVLADQRDREVVLFFGYTHCPDVCPTTLANLARIDRAKLTPEERAKVTIAFVTVDPARDTAARLAKYVHLFGPRIVGLRGTDAQLATVEHDWHVWHQKTHVTKSGYDVSHSSTIFVVAPGGDLVAVHDWADPDDVVAADLEKYAS